MKQTKIISFVIALVTVVALGIIMGKYMFSLIDGSVNQNKNNPQNNANIATSSNNTEPEKSTVQILYREGQQQPSESEFKQNIQSASNGKAIEIATNDLPKKNITKENNSEKAITPANETLVFSPTGPRWYAYASTNGLNVRESPDVKGKFMFKVAKGTRGVVKEKKNGWTYIQWDFNKKKGWSTDEYLVQGPANVVESLVNKASGNKIENINKEKLTQATIEKELENSKIIIGVAKPASITETVITYSNGKELPKRGTITPQGGANIREEPSTTSKRLIKLPKGTTVGIKSVKQVENFQWFEVTYSNGTKTGWAREDVLKF